MQQLSATDNFFLLSEHNTVYNHVGMLMIYDVSTAPEGKVRFKDILRHFDDRLPKHPIFRRKLITAPFGVDHPYWVEDLNIDVEYHIRHIALPKPGDWRQLMIQVARLHSRPIDRSHPLWEAYIIEGLDNIPKLPPGSFAMFLKLHHSAIDGAGGVQLAEQIHSVTATRAKGAPRERMVYLDHLPSPIELLSRAVGNGFQRAGQVGQIARRTTSIALTACKQQVAGLRQRGAIRQTAVQEAPASVFNNPVSGNRVADGFGLPHSRLRIVQARCPEASFDDIFLAVVGSGVARYLRSRQVLPKSPLVACLHLPQTPGTDAIATELASYVSLCSDTTDPLDRLHSARRELAKGRAAAEMGAMDSMAQLVDALPPQLSRFVINHLGKKFNLTASRIDGPDKPLYLAGAKAMCLYPIDRPTDGAALDVSAASYNGVMWISAVSCRDIVPDPAFLIQCLRESWEEILAATQASPKSAVLTKVRSRKRAVEKAAAAAGAA